METKWELVSSGARHKFQMVTGKLTIVTDLKKDEIPNFGNVFKLSCSSGSVPDIRVRRKDLEYDFGCVVVTFDGLCLASSYTLTARINDGSEIVVFENIPYDQLVSLSQDIDNESTEPW
jgi:hypothetical protein